MLLSLEQLLLWCRVLMLLVYIQNRCKDNRQSNFPQFDTEYHLISTVTYFTGAIELSRLKSAQTIVFTLLVIFTCINTSTKLETVFIYASIPIRIFWYHLNNKGYYLPAMEPMINGFNWPGSHKLCCRNLRTHQDSSAHRDNLNKLLRQQLKILKLITLETPSNAFVI